MEKLPEDYLFNPLDVCSQCVGLREYGWLDEAKQKSIDLVIPTVQSSCSKAEDMPGLEKEAVGEPISKGE